MVGGIGVGVGTKAIVAGAAEVKVAAGGAMDVNDGVTGAVVRVMVFTVGVGLIRVGVGAAFVASAALSGVISSIVALVGVCVNDEGSKATDCGVLLTITTLPSKGVGVGT
jgi:hypothetical protein